MSGGRGWWGSVVRVLRLVGGEMSWWLGGLVRLVRWAPKRALLWGASLAVGVWWDCLLLVGCLIVPVVAVAVWARLGPVSFARWVSGPAGHRRVRRQVKRSWASFMDVCGLGRRVRLTYRRVPRPGEAMPPSERLDVPRLVSARWSGDQLVLSLGLLAGQTVGDVEAAVERLRTTLGAYRVRVVANDARTACRLIARFGDPLAEAFELTAAEGSDQLAVGVVDRPVLGRAEDGGPWAVDLRVSTLAVGASGSGKGSVMWSLLVRLAPAIRSGVVQVHGVDLKGGMELGLGRALFCRYADDPLRAVVLLEEAVAACEGRARRMAGVSRDHVPSAAEPLVVVLIDELASLVAYLSDRELLRRAEAALARLCSIGRAPGFFVYGFVQDPRKETLRCRHLFQQAVALRLRDREEVAMVLGEGAVAAGAGCHLISRATPGVGFAQDESGRLVRVRASYVSDATIREVAQRFAAPVQVPIEVPVVEVGPRERPAGARGRSRSGSAAA